MDCHALGLPDNRYDVTGSLFGAMLVPDQAQALREMVRVTKPGGRVLLIAYGNPAEFEALHVFISAARTLGVPARYVVGYLLAQDTKLTETHAWAEAWVPEIGWVGFDAANRLCPTDRYVRLGCGLDAADAAPIRGNVSGNSQERLSASVDISQTTGQSQSQNQGDGVQSQTQQ